MHLILFVLIGLIAGALAGRVVSGHGYGMLGDLVVGVVGAFLGGWLFAVAFGVVGGGFLVSLLLLIRLFQHATMRSVRAWRALRFRRICASFSVNSPPTRPVSTTWLRVVGRTGSRAPAADTLGRIA